MVTDSTSIEHTERRLIVVFDSAYESLVTLFEATVPEIDTSAFSALSSWQEHLDLAQETAPHGFLRYFQADLTAAFATAPAEWTARQYLMGNHTIAQRMFRHDPSVMLHAPLRVLLYVDPAGATCLAVDQPSLLFASYGNPEIDAVGDHLDALVAELITTLGGVPPRELLATDR